MVSHSYSIYIWNPLRPLKGIGAWEEPYQCFTQQDALYIANLIHRDSKAVIKVVRYGFNIACFPDEHTVERVERQIARLGQREPHTI